MYGRGGGVAHAQHKERLPAQPGNGRTGSQLLYTAQQARTSKGEGIDGGIRPGDGRQRHQAAADAANVMRLPGHGLSGVSLGILQATAGRAG